MPEKAASAPVAQPATQTPTTDKTPSTAPAPAAATPPKAPDTTPRPPEGEPAKPDKLAASWEKIQKLEARHRDEQSRFKAEQAAFAKEREAFAKERAEAEAYKKLMTDDPVAWFEKHAPPNLFEDVARRYVGGGKPSPEEVDRKRSEEIASLKEEIQRFRREQEEAQIQTQVAAYHAALQEELEKPDYELIKSFNAQQEIVDLVVQWQQQHRELLTPQKAASMIEAELENQLKSVSAAKKARTLLGLPEPEQEKTPTDPAPPAGGTETAQQPAAQAKTTTLTNDMTSAAPAQSRRAKTREQKLKEAAAQLQALRQRK